MILSFNSSSKICLFCKRFIISIFSSMIFILASIALWYFGYNAVSSKYSVYASNRLGKDFNNFVGVSSELAGLSVLTESVESQSLTADALASDVEAGLRVGDATEELAAMVETVGNNALTLAKLTSEFEALSAEVEQTYTNAIKSTGSDTKNALKSVNTKASAALKSSAVTLADLASRVSNCETELADIQGRLTQIEASVAELLSKIQSLTFMSEYSEEYAVAYYSMETSKVSAPGKPYDGKNTRTPVNNIELNYMVRPAAAASAVTAEVVNVVGYYAYNAVCRKVRNESGRCCRLLPGRILERNQSGRV